MRTGIVDRLEQEGRLAVIELEDRRSLVLPRERIRGPVAPGDAVREEADGTWVVDRQRTEARRREAERLFRQVWGEEPG
ncbi:MAG: DUF3006 domain-containing protein, partial [Bacillota bacterium]|nr:DUF3006 domain-containing protein [Bacillota bacterium]